MLFEKSPHQSQDLSVAISLEVIISGFGCSLTVEIHIYQ